ncbi:MAG: dual specificity protein phosphatase family protein [Rhabdaerophilum sp.]
MADSSIEPFTIATLDLGKARIGISRLPGRSGDLAGDIATIRDWGTAAVVSMTGFSEMVAKDVDDLAPLLAANGIAHFHFPIRDFGTPEQADARWPELAALLHARLDAGEAVLLHCMGGHGRSGMVALRLLVERGMDSEAALRLIRQARPGAVETAAQVNWGMKRDA